MAAGMHDTGGFGCIGQSGGLFDGQRVHICAQAHDFSFAVRAPFDQRHHARAANARDDLITAKLCEPIGDKLRSAGGFEQKFRILVNVTPPRGYFGQQL